MARRTAYTSSLALAATLALSVLVARGARGLELRQVTRPYLHSEGPSWDRAHNGLLFVDIAGDSLHFYDAATGGVRGLAFEGPVTPAIQLPGGTLAVGVGRTLQEVDWAASGFGAVLASRPAVLATVDQDKPGNRFNDGAADSLGRMWIGTMGPEPVVGQVTPNQGSLFRITRRRSDADPLWSRLVDPRGHRDTDGGAALVTTALANVSISNGLVFNRRETLMYYIDTPTRRVDVFDYNLAAGTIANRRPAFDLAANNVEGNPDGMAIDADDNLWVACFGGSQVIHVDPRTGRLLRRVAIPASQVTAVALGGPRDAQGGDTLYVTSMRKGLSEDQLLLEPNAGAVFAVTGLGVRAQRRP
ncbi:regucalcin-like [Thrips palmi]|uniref:Regucalcin-like n=1 Tax=Thrips palmi TaxID=161013 RepID=A0A6P9A5H9_THRPL|nr:regucalcin-like [Thrips palmi]